MRAVTGWLKTNQKAIIFWVLFWSSICFLIAPFIWQPASILSLVALVPFWLLLENTAEHTNRQRVFLIWLIGFGSMLGVLFWVLQTMPERWVYIYGWAANTSLFINYLLFAGLFSLSFLLFGFSYVYLKLKISNKKIFLIAPMLWLASEWLRSWVFSIAAYGPGASLGPSWSFGSLGLAIAGTPLGYAARLVGLSGLSALAIVFSLAVIWALRKRYWPLALIVLASVALASSGYLLYQPTTETKKVAYVQLPPDFNNPGSPQDQAAQLESDGEVDVLVLPEYADPAILEGQLATLLSPNGLIVTSRLISSPGRMSNQLQVLNSQLKPLITHEKSFLIPIGEYVPYVHQGILKILGQQQALDLHAAYRGLTERGPRIPNAVASNLVLAAQVCSGAVTPGLYQQQVKDGAQLLTNSASLSMFSQAHGYQVQSQQFARFIALANARPFVQAATGGHGFILDSNGEVLSGRNKLGFDYQSGTVRLTKTMTLYSLVGEWVRILAIVGIIVLFVARLKKRWL